MAATPARSASQGVFASYSAGPLLALRANSLSARHGKVFQQAGPRVRIAPTAGSKALWSVGRVNAIENSVNPAARGNSLAIFDSLQNRGADIPVCPAWSSFQQAVRGETMWNRAISNFAADDAEGNGRSWATDGHPTRRLVWLFVTMALPVAVIAGRLLYLQGFVAEEFIELQETLVTTYEWVPARDGRILSAEGSVLAEDVVRYEVHAHFRWLEEPADDRWLRRRAISQTGTAERRQPEKMQAAKDRVLRQRTDMWSRLTTLTGIAAAELQRRRERIQHRIQRRVQLVEDRREKRTESNAASQMEQEDSAAHPAARLWHRIVTTLTTPPHRGRREAVVLPEQSDYHRLLESVSERAAKEIESHPELYPGLQVRMATRRHYPAATIAAHLIGYRKDRAAETDTESTTVIDGRTLHLPPRKSTVGKTGIEQRYDAALRGQPGIRKVLRNNRGEILRTEIVRAPQAGHDVLLTVESRLQQRMEQLLDDALSKTKTRQPAGSPTQETVPPRGGCLIAVDVRTGAILAAASAPRFDLNILTENRPDEWRQLTTDPRRPLFPRESRMTLPPGSVFKTVSAVALLESGKIDPDARISCQGYLDRPDRHRCYIFRHYGVGHGEINLNEAITRSCNVYFYTAARKLGPNPLVEWSRRFGFGQPTGVDLPGERRGHLPAPTTRNRGPISTVSQHREPPWYPGDTLGLAIGQSRLTVTPLQIARMMAAVANDGYLVTPHLLRRIDSARRTIDGESSRHQFPRHRIPGLTEATLQRVREGLRNVVENPRGTGFKHVRLQGIAIAGKTGTAEVGGGRPDHAWFAGYAPADNPRVAFVVVLEHSGAGGRTAGPVAKQLVQTLLDTGAIRPSPTPKTAATTR